MLQWCTVVRGTMGCACGSSNIMSNQAISAGASTKGSSGHAVWECRHLVAFWPFPNLPDPCCPSAGDAACLQCLPVWPGQLLCHTGQSASSREQVWTRQNCSGTYHRMELLLPFYSQLWVSRECESHSCILGGCGVRSGGCAR